MTFWNAARLADDLREGRVSEREKLRYLLLLVALHSLAGSGSASVVDALRSDRPGAALWPLLGFVIAVVGLVACFRANARGDGRHFLDRIYCLAVPVWIPVYVAYLAAAFALERLAGPMTPVDGSRPKLGPYLLWVLLLLAPAIVGFVRLRRYVARAAGTAP